MAIKVDRTRDILDRLESEGHVQIMNSPEALAARDVINEFAEKIRREYLEKERLSLIEASQFVITA